MASEFILSKCQAMSCGSVPKGKHLYEPCCDFLSQPCSVLPTDCLCMLFFSVSGSEKLVKISTVVKGNAEY